MSATSSLSTERDRSKIPPQYTWDLGPVYSDFDAWKAAKDRLLADIARIDAFRGTLAGSPAQLLACLDLSSAIGKAFSRLYTYAQAHADIDTKDAAFLGYQQEIGQIGADIGARTAFIEPEILRMGREAVEAFLAAEPGLGVYRHPLNDTLRRREHTGTETEEKIIAEAGLMAESSANIFTIFSNADFPFPDVTLHDGSSVHLDNAAFALYRTLAHREDRERVFQAHFSTLHTYRRTFGVQLYSELRKNLFYQRARNYPSCLHGALHGGNIPTDVYHTLIHNVHTHLPVFHRYLDLRRRLLAVEELHHYDLYAPAAAGVELTYTFEEARELILASLSPLGESYGAVARRSFTERWMDVFPSEGKISGAYSNGAVYDIHPFILLNYNGKYDDVSTVTHELGHTMHSYLSNARQAYPTARYSIFVAEVASTFNEALLMEHMLATIADDRIRLSLLMNYLDGIKATLFRQVQFAEFELKIHEIAEAGQSLTGDSLSALYLDLARMYYGHDRGVCVVDEWVRAEWASVPHFYYNFYVYQYATSLTASAALAEMVLAGDRSARARYLALLGAGGSDYPIELLRDAGVDMTTSGPFILMMRKMERAMDAVEEIIGAKR